MILPSALWLLCSGLALAATTPGQLVLFDPPGHPPIPSSLDLHLRPETAKLLLAHRLGFSDQYSLVGSDDHDLGQLDTLGGPRQHPFSLPNQEDLRPRVLVVIEGLWLGDVDVALKGHQDLITPSISPGPSTRSTAEVMEEFMAEAGTYSSLDTSGQTSWKDLEILAAHPDNKIVKHGGRTIAYIRSPMTTQEMHGDQSTQYSDELQLIKNALKELYSSAYGSTPNNMIGTVLAMPPGKQHYTTTWGPKLQRRSESEAFLAASVKGSAKSKAQSQPVSSSPLGANAVPARYSSLDSCERTTKNCTGHGECVRLSSESVGDRTNDIFGCVCNKPSVRTNQDGSKKTTYYAGSACQKVDISQPFWLLAGTTVFLLTVVSLGVGMLYSMGSEELPSVIGAGVTGPRAK